MKRSRIAAVFVLAATAVLIVAGCSSNHGSAQMENRASFNGGPMPADVGKIIAERAQASAARAAQHHAPAN